MESDIQIIPRGRNIQELFEQQASLTPESVALVYEEEQMSYAELNARSNQLARYLEEERSRSRGRSGDMRGEKLEMVIGLMGILKAGGCYVPLDPAYPAERLAFMLEDAEIELLVSEEKQIEALPEYGGEIILIDREREEIAEESEENVESGVSSDNLAYVIYTSGSTGKPKGVMIEHRSMINYLCWINETLIGDLRYIMPATIRLLFDASIRQIFAPILRGDAAWIISDEVIAQPPVLLEAINTRSNVALSACPRFGGPSSTRFNLVRRRCRMKASPALWLVVSLLPKIWLRSHLPRIPTFGLLTSTGLLKQL